MTLSQTLFSFKGRINRAKFWLLLLIPLLILIGSITIDLLRGILIILWIWTVLAIHVKRWHDLDKSGWWVLVEFVPIIGFWALVELGFLKGTDGPNRFGPDPLVN